MHDLHYKPTLGSTEKGYPPAIYKEYLFAASSSIVTTIHCLSSLLGANEAVWFTHVTKYNGNLQPLTRTHPA